MVPPFFRNEYLQKQLFTWNKLDFESIHKQSFIICPGQKFPNFEVSRSHFTKSAFFGPFLRKFCHKTFLSSNHFDLNVLMIRYKKQTCVTTLFFESMARTPL